MLSVFSFTNIKGSRDEVQLLLKLVRWCKSAVLNEFGYGDKVKEVLNMEGTVLLMLSWIDNILLGILDPSIELEREQRCGHLEYQKHGHYVLGSTKVNVHVSCSPYIYT